MAPDPILRIRSTDPDDIVDLLGSDSGWELADPGWQPKIAQLKGGGTMTSSPLAHGSTLVHGKRDNVIETIPLSVRGNNQDLAIKTIRKLLQLLRQASDYWTESYEYDNVWLEAKPACNNCLTGYARIVKANIDQLGNPFGQPFFTTNNESVMEDLILVLEREPFWRSIPPGEMIGPLYNLIKNPDFELFGASNTSTIGNVIPDSWDLIQTTHISGFIENVDQDVAPPKFGENSCKIRVSGSTLAGAAQGITQNIESIANNQEYTIIAWVRSEGVSNGVGRILVTYASQLELYRSSSTHGWTLYVDTFTTGVGDVVGITCEILATAANTDGTIFIDGMMLLEGDWEQEAIDGVLPYLSSSHIANHLDLVEANGVVDAGDINYVDVWNIPGDVDSLIRLEMINNTIPSDEGNPDEVIEYVRIGQKRSRDVLKFDYFHDPVGVTASDVAGDGRLESAALNPDFQSITTKIINSEFVPHNIGRFRVFARVLDNQSAGDPNLQVRLRYFQGTTGTKVKQLSTFIPFSRGVWTIADLTKREAMVQDYKFKSDIPAQIGYTVQFARPAGSENAYLDYVLVMPTDGGFIEASTLPALRMGDAFVVDNTFSSRVGCTHTKGNKGPRLNNAVGGRKTLLNTPSTPRSAHVFKGDLYVGCDGGELIRYNAGLSNQTQVQDYGASSIKALEVWAERLYIAHGLDVYSSDGSSFSATADFTVPTGTSISSMHEFRGKLYIGVNGGTAPVYKWDGSALTLDFETNETNVTDIEAGMGALWVGTSGNIGLYTLDFNNNWAQQLGAADFPGESGISKMIEWRGRLRIGTTPGGKMWRWVCACDTSPVLLTFNLPTTTSVDAIASEHRAKEIIVGGTPAAPIRFTEKWNMDKGWTDLFEGKELEVTLLHVYEGQLVVGTVTNNVVEVIPTEDTVFKNAEFRGAPFTAPPTKRHRYVFSYDRKAGVNAVDDKALVGIGFVPRYFSLRGHG